MRLYEIYGRRATPLDQYKDDLAKVAQEVYDKWDEHPDEYAGGGICHLIADEIAGYLSDKGFDTTTISADIGEVHVWTAALVPGVGIFNVDINPYTYETGGGYSWKKIPDVVFEPEDVTIDFIATEDERDNYFEGDR